MKLLRPKVMPIAAGLFIASILAACAGLSGVPADYLPPAPPIALEGAVLDREGQPLSGLVMTLATDSGAVTTVTDGNGAFSLTCPAPGPPFLEISGPEGIGRVPLDAMAPSAPLRLSYPVITEIIFLHDNDLHFDYNHRDAFEEAVAWFRSEYDNVYLLSAGDIFVRHQHKWPIPTIDFYSVWSRYMIEAMNEVGYDLMTPGNHELDYKEHYTRDSLRLAQFPLIAANVDVSTVNFDPLEPYAVLDTANGHTIAVLGLCYLNAEREGIEVGEPAATIEHYRHLRDEHDVFMLLTHIGINPDRALAARFPQLDLIIGGHTNTLLETAEEVNGVLVAQAGGHPHEVEPERPKFLGVIRVVLENDAIVKKHGHVLTFDAETTGVTTLLENLRTQWHKQDYPAEAVTAD
jgi:2',3'-cyclic-nucleotide 2'-phosphodiesterase (5'-nucleotidase family)